MTGYLSTTDVMQELKVSGTKVRHLISTGEIKATKFGRNYKITPEDLKDYMHKKEQSYSYYEGVDEDKYVDDDLFGNYDTDREVTEYDDKILDYDDISYRDLRIIHKVICMFEKQVNSLIRVIEEKSKNNDESITQELIITERNEGELQNEDMLGKDYEAYCRFCSLYLAEDKTENSYDDQNNDDKVTGEADSNE